MFFFFNDTATTEIYTLSLHDALPIFRRRGGIDPAPLPVLLAAVELDAVERAAARVLRRADAPRRPCPRPGGADRKSTRLNSSHANISYAVFCLKKKNNSYK